MSWATTYAPRSVAAAGPRRDAGGKMFVRVGVSGPHCSGSAYVERTNGGTKVACTVHGPFKRRFGSGGDLAASAASGSLFCDVRFAPFASPERDAERAGTGRMDDERAAAIG